MNEREIFEKALDLTDPDARAAFCDVACGDDLELRWRIEALLQSHEQADSFLKGPAEANSPTIGMSPSIAMGTHVGPYKLLQRLGEGGMGEVYMAEQTEPVERLVAIKIIKSGMDSRQVIARFEAERQALAMMEHPNISKVLDAGTTEAGRPYFAMELVRGVPITKYCDQHRLTTRERLTLFQGVCYAVQHAHQKGIIHRDLKPSNVMVADDDDRPVLKIIDFGVAKATQRRLTEKTVFTEVGTMVGTVEYMSPEQAKLNQLDIDTRSDVYSLGVLLYELLTGDTPFGRKRLRGAAFDEMLRIIREEEPSCPSLKLATTESAATVASHHRVEAKRLRKLVRGELDWIVMKALEKDRTRRYDTAHALGVDIGHYLHDEPVTACPPSAAYRLRKLAHRYRGALSAASVVLLVLICSSILSTWLAIRATTAEATAEDLLDSTSTALESEQVARQQADAATERATRSLFDALLAQAKASNSSGRMGQRVNALQIILEATKIGRQLKLGEEARLQLRNEAIAALSLPDLIERKRWEGLPHTDTPWAISPAADTFIIVDDAQEANYLHVVPVGENKPALLKKEIRYSDRSRMVYDSSGRYLCLNTSDHGSGVYDLHNRNWVLDSIPAVRNLESVDFSLDSRLVAAGCTDGVLRIYSLLEPRNEHRVAVESANASTACDEARIPLATSSLGGITSEKALVAEHLAVDGTPTVLRFSPDGKQLAVAWEGKPKIEIRDSISGKIKRSLQANHHYIAALAWHPSGKELAAGMWQRIDRWDLTRADQHPTVTMLGHQSLVNNLAYHSSGIMLISDSWDGSVRLWNASWGRQLLQTMGRLSVAILNNREFGFSNGLDLGLWTVVEPDICRWSHPGLVFDSAASADGRILALAFFDGVRLVDPKTGRELCHLPIDQTYGLLFHPSSGTLITSGRRGVYVWPVAWEFGTQAATETRLRVGPPREFSPHLHNPVNIAASREGNRLIVDHGKPQDANPPLRISEATIVTRDTNPETSINLRHRHLHGVAISPNGQWAATCATSGGKIQIWNALTGGLASELDALGSARAEFSPDNRWVVTNSGQAVRFWLVGDWSLEFEFPAHVRSGSAIAFTPDSRYVAFGRDGQGITIMDFPNRRELATLAIYSGDTRVEDLCFTPSGSHLIAVVGETGLCVWDLSRTRERLMEMGLDWDPPPSPTRDDLHSVPLQSTVLLGQMVRHELGDDLDVRHDFGLAQAESLNRRLVQIDAAIIYDSQDPQLWYLRGLIHSAFGNYTQACQDFSRCLNLKPTSANAFYQRAKAYRWCGEIGRALDDFEKALELDSGQRSRARMDTLNLIAAILVLGPTEYRDPKRALGLCEELASLVQADANAQRTRAFALYRLGRYADAINVMQQSLDRRGGRGVALDYLLLAGCQTLLGDATKGKAYYQQGQQAYAKYSIMSTRGVRQFVNELMLTAEILGVEPPLAESTSQDNHRVLESDALLLHAVASEGKLWRRRMNTKFPGKSARQNESAAQLLWCPAHPQATLVAPISVARSGAYRLALRLFSHPSGGDFQLRIGGQLNPDRVNLYSEQTVRQSMTFDAKLVAGVSQLEFTVVGRNPLAAGYQLALEAIEITSLELE